jgi:hypothetical protein
MQNFADETFWATGPAGQSIPTLGLHPEANDLGCYYSILRGLPLQVAKLGVVH